MIQANNIKSLSFNQDYSCLAVGFENSYKVYNCDPFGECFNKNDDGGANLIEMLFSTSLIAIVGLGDKPSNSSRKLKIINTKRKSIICELTFPTSVLYVKLNRKRLIVVLIDQIFIYDVSCMKLLHTIETSTSNASDKIIADLSSSDESILAFQQSLSNGPGSHSSISGFTSGHNSSHGNNNNINNSNSHIGASDSTGLSNSGSFNEDSPLIHSSGTVILFDALNIQPLNIIECHKSPLQKIAISKDGTLLATASTKGTIIRVFRVNDGKKVHEFRRGSYSALISCLNFNLDSTILSCSSNTGTIHFFKLGIAAKKGTSDFQTLSTSPQPPTQQNNDEDLQTTTTEASNDSNPDLPHETVMTDEENLEINRLINNQISKSASGPAGLFYNGKKSTESLKNFIWAQSKSYLPSQLNSILEPKRHYAYVKLPVETESVVCVVDSTCFVVTFKGDFLIYNIPSSSHLNGGGSAGSGTGSGGSECVLLKQYRLNEE